MLPDCIFQNKNKKYYLIIKQFIMIKLKINLNIFLVATSHTIIVVK